MNKVILTLPLILAVHLLQAQNCSQKLVDTTRVSTNSPPFRLHLNFSAFQSPLFGREGAVARASEGELLDNLKIKATMS